jgi:hypothetical protein
VKHTKQYLREAIRRREIQGHEFTSVPILYNMVREFLLRDGEQVPANLWMRIQQALCKVVRDQEILAGRISGLRITTRMSGAVIMILTSQRFMIVFFNTTRRDTNCETVCTVS